jgi:hypothetical protein
MATAEYLPDSLEEMDRLLLLMGKARKSAEIIEAMRAYLSGWPTARVARVQRVDAGWAPFDDNQRPMPIVGSLDVRQIYDALHGQVESLKESGVPPTPEILELELVFFFANFLLDDLEPEFLAARAPDVRPENRTPLAG